MGWYHWPGNSQRSIPMKQNDVMENYLTQHLLGQTISRIVKDDSSKTRQDLGSPLYALVLGNGKHVWILSDAEGNGPGHLEVEL